MSLTVTVQKGHDFSSGNITRAALNSGATPTVAVTGSVGSSEIAADAVTSTELADDASTDSNRAVTTDHIRDLAVTEGKLANDSVSLAKLAHYGSKGHMVKMGDTAEAGTVIPESLDCTGSGKILLGTGSDVLSLASSTGSLDEADTIAANTPESHIAIAPATFASPATEPASALLTVKDGALPVSTLRTNKVGGELKSGVVAFNNSGTPIVLETEDADKIVASTSSGVALKVRDKEVPLLGAGGRTTYGVSSDADTQDRTFVGAHGLTAVPKNVSVYLEVVSGQTDLGYAAGDRVMVSSGQTPVEGAYYAVVTWDNTNVVLQTNHNFYIFNKATTAADSVQSLEYIAPEKWKVIALVSE
tara:strand:+ start:3185 stop:4264 length:1080 start_codon:yes stop_codon:yes gene_type:complete